MKPIEPAARWRAIRAAALLLVAALTAVALALSVRVQGLQEEIRALQDRVRQLSYNTASGGGVNLKFMPDPRTGAPTVPLQEIFSFDRNHAICRVDTNPQAFKMTTFQLGEVVVPAHQFFMSMAATTVDQYAVTALPDGTRRVTMRGGLSCSTEIGLATVTVGSRTAAEHATYLIEAVDAGIGGGQAGDRFAFTAFFDPVEAPINYKIFGPKATFTGRMIEGRDHHRQSAAIGRVSGCAASSFLFGGAQRAVLHRGKQCEGPRDRCRPSAGRRVCGMTPSATGFILRSTRAVRRL